LKLGGISLGRNKGVAKPTKGKLLQVRRKKAQTDCALPRSGTKGDNLEKRKRRFAKGAL